MPAKKKTEKKRVTFRPKSSFQKGGCINRSAEYDCPNKSTQEAVCGSSMVRCCGEKKCMEAAAEMARATATAFTFTRR